MAIEGDLLVVGASRSSVSWIGQSDGAAYLFRRNATDPDRWDYVVRLIAPGADQCVGGLTLSQFLHAGHGRGNGGGGGMRAGELIS